LRHQDFRNSRRREFDADTEYRHLVHSAPRPGSVNLGSRLLPEPPASGVVKWFSPEKGLGFVALPDGSGDAFLHGSVLARSGISAVEPGETLEVRVGPGHKGPPVTEVLSLYSSTAIPSASRPQGKRVFDSYRKIWVCLLHNAAEFL
jgi:CspA family cold shock protein